MAWALTAGFGDRPESGAGEVLVAAAGFAGAAMAALFVQGRLLVWLRPGPRPEVLRWAAEETRNEAGAYRAEMDSRPWASSRDRWAAEDRHAAWRASRRYRTEERFLLRPLAPPAAVAAGVRIAETTGLVVDQVWPRISMVAPAAVTRAEQRRSGLIALLRVTVAAALCAALALPAAAELRWAASSPAAADLALLAAGPLLAGLAALSLARRAVGLACTRRAHAVELYRYDLAERLRLPRPRNNYTFAGLAGVLSGDEYLWDLPLAWSGGEQSEELAEEVTRRVVREVRRLLGEERAAAAHTAPAATPGPLGAGELPQLAAEIAKRSTGPLGDRLAEQMASSLTELYERTFNAELRAAVLAAVEESVLGPPLVNFTGYLLLQLAGQDGQDAGQDDAGPAPRAVGGVIVAPPSRQVAFDLTVVRDERARNAPPVLTSSLDQDFYVFEPVSVEGGQDLPTADFDALADSATLTPLPPERRALRTGRQSRTTFRFRLPAEEGRHEVWFQLYQGGRLIQVVALTVVATTGEVTGAGGAAGAAP
ncbi:hypothetical protein [Streptomyces sp. URMC 129]|uniref:hypothetical protein n=1 Tax=Streptomyces sp. URMC 129 TaxID=3423407 RepID=UPI003F1A46CB